MRAISERGNLWELAVLSLVREGPMHPYQMLRLLRERHKDDVLVLKRGSIYHAINRLEKAGLIAAVTVEREGRRPERTTYQLTAKGEKELVDWLQERVANVQRAPSEFMGTLSFLVHLPPSAAATHLQARLVALQNHLSGLEAGMAQARAFVERINLIESEYLLAMLKAEIHWVRALLVDLREGSFSWDLKQILKALRPARRKEAGRRDGPYE